MEIGIVSDEIVPGFREAIDIGMEWGIRKYEIRTLKTGRIPDVDEGEIREVLGSIRTEGIEVTALSPGLFKIPVSDRERVRREIESILPETIDLAERLGTRRIIVFGFQRQPDEPEDNLKMTIDFLTEAAERAGKSGMTLLIENEPGFWCDSGSNTASILDEISSPSLRANWDPCNAFGMDEPPFPVGYSSIRKFVANVHVKDTRRGALVECVPVGDGLLDWKGQLSALVRDHPVGHVTIETHSLPLIEKSKKNVEVIRRLLSEIESDERS